MRNQALRNTSGVFLLIAALGSAWAFSRGGQDFAVFYAAAEHVARGEPAKLYLESPDRYLYAPGFAWWMAPLSIFPSTIALAIWTVLRVGLGLWAVRAWSRAFSQGGASSRWTPWLGAIALLITARFWLIDFQYGQVNLLLFAFGTLALLEKRNSPGIWLALGALSAIKLITLPLLLLSLVGPGAWKRAGAAAAGVGLAVLTPLLTLSVTEWLDLHREWLGAIQSKGLPLYTHNQSFVAFLHRWLGEVPSRPVFLPEAIDFSMKWFSVSLVSVLGGLWFLGTLVILLRLLWQARTNSAGSPRVYAWILAWIPLPHYLVWKPYFLFVFPAVWLAATYALSPAASRLCRGVFVVSVAAFTLSGFDVVGVYFATVLESLSIFLWATLGILWVSQRGIGASPFDAGKSPRAAGE